MESPANSERNTAIVLGASLSGLMTTAVLARHYRRVVVVERDELPASVAPRKGVAQGRHNHNISPRATQVLSRILPGLLDELRAHGASVCDIGGDGTWIVSGHRIRRVAIDQAQILASRPLLDSLVVDRLRAESGVELRDCTDVCGLTGSRDRVEGVRLLDRRSGIAETVEADLVVDCSGRGSRTPRWLEELGLDAPEEERIEVDVHYTTRVFHRRPDDLDGDRFVYVSARVPDRPRGSVAFAVDGDRWMVLLFGYGVRPPTDLDGFRGYARELGVPELSTIVTSCDPIGDASTYRFSASTRRRYDRCRAVPRGLIVLGDALQSTNPSWGLGITSAALQIEVLADRLDARKPVDRRWYAAALRAAAPVWDSIAGRDLAFDCVKGSPAAPFRVLGRLVEGLFLAARTDLGLARLTMGMVGQLHGPLGILRPDRLVRILVASRRHRAALPAVASPSRAGRSDMLGA